MPAAPLTARGGTNCWICGGQGITREHKSKRSDLRAVFGTTSQQRPLYMNSETRKNKRIGSFDAGIFKFPGHNCLECNSSRTQPHDRAWERMSAYLLKSNPVPGTTIKAQDIFPTDADSQMLNVHLFFLKHFGCLIDEGKIRMDVRPFATAIMNEKAHPQVHLKFGLAPSLDGKPILGQSDVEVFYEKADGSCAFATYLYHVGKVAVCVMFVVDEQAWRKDLIGAWHPRSEADEFGFGDFS